MQAETPIRTYIYKEYEIPFCGGVALIMLHAEIYHRDGWHHPLAHVPVAQLIREGVSGVQIRDIVTHEDFECPFSDVIAAFPDLDLNDCGFCGSSGIIAKDGHPFDPEEFYAWKKRENLLMPGA